MKDSVIDLCIYDGNYRIPLEDSLEISNSKKGESILEELLRDRIIIRETGLETQTYMTPLFVCIQEMLRNAVMNHDWKSKALIEIEAMKHRDNNIGIQVKNMPIQEKRERLNSFWRSILYDEEDEHEGFGTLWLKSVKEILEGKFYVNSMYPFELEIRFPRPEITRRY